MGICLPTSAHLRLWRRSQLVAAAAAVDELRRHGDLWKLDEELPKGEVHFDAEGD